MPRRRSKSKGVTDIPMDEEDQFHTSHDKILLDEDEPASEDGDEDEVFGLKGLSEEDSDGESENQDNMEMEEDPAPVIKSKKSTSKKLALEDSSESSKSDSEEEIWGRNKSAYYSSNAAQLESDDEEANELEEEEAKRLQAKAREAMGEDDFGLGDSLDDVGQDDIDAFAEPISHIMKPLLQDKQSLSPEALALARDWDDTAWNLIKSQAKIQKLETEKHDALSLGMIHMHYQALLTYATTLAFYLHMQSSEKYSQHPELLRSHPVLKRLLILKQALLTLEDDAQSSLDTPRIAATSSASKPPKKKRKMGTAESKEPKEPVLPVFDLVEPMHKRSDHSSFIASDDIGDTDAYGEATSLQHADQADKNARKKSLRFHISKIESASARRLGARDSAVGGDDDIPYKERRKEKQAQMAKELEEKKKVNVQGQGGEDLDDIESENEVGKRPRNEEDEDDVEEDADGYYELVKRKTKAKKEKKKADYEDAQAAARPDLQDDTTAGPRSLTRAILSNKGLTPHRSKSVRNPRVKKKHKFEKAKKKLSSQKAVYKGGIGDIGKYDGERSGISKVVKSVRLG